MCVSVPCDLHSNGWYTLLSWRYQGRADLYNRGYAGYTTRNALTTLRQHLRAGIWPYSAATASQSQSSTAVAGIERLVLLWLGTNDSCTHFTSLPNMHVPLAPFTANMRHIVHTLLSATAAHTLLPPASHTTKLLILTPLDQPHWQAYRRHKYSLPLSHPPAAALPAMPYVEAVKSVAAECDVAVCDVSTGGVLPADECGHWSVDGIHLNAEGNRRVYDAIVAAVERHWPELAVERLPLDGDAQIE